MKKKKSTSPSTIHVALNTPSRFKKVSAKVVRDALIRHCKTSRDQLAQFSKIV